jgi:hypothetical protein
MRMKLLIALILATSLVISSASAQTDSMIKLNSDSFEPGQTVMINGNAEEKTLSVQVQDPTGKTILLRTVMADSSGNFALKFKIPPNSMLGDYQVFISIVVDGTPVIHTSTFKVVEKISGTAPIEQTQESKGGGCLIATAAFGSEMAPQVQFLRELRDNTVLQTESGTSFMAGFNQFYYSFSPAIADYERENPVFKETVKLTLTPLLTSLTLLQYTDIDSESEMLGYGIGIILLNIGMYFVAPAVVIMAVRKIR